MTNQEELCGAIECTTRALDHTPKTFEAMPSAPHYQQVLNYQFSRQADLPIQEGSPYNPNNFFEISSSESSSEEQSSETLNLFGLNKSQQLYQEQALQLGSGPLDYINSQPIKRSSDLSPDLSNQQDLSRMAGSVYSTRSPYLLPSFATAHHIMGPHTVKQSSEPPYLSSCPYDASEFVHDIVSFEDHAAPFQFGFIPNTVGDGVSLGRQSEGPLGTTVSGKDETSLSIVEGESSALLIESEATSSQWLFDPTLSLITNRPGLTSDNNGLENPQIPHPDTSHPSNSATSDVGSSDLRSAEWPTTLPYPSNQHQCQLSSRHPHFIENFGLKATQKLSILMHLCQPRTYSRLSVHHLQCSRSFKARKIVQHQSWSPRRSLTR